MNLKGIGQILAAVLVLGGVAVLYMGTRSGPVRSVEAGRTPASVAPQPDGRQLLRLSVSVEKYCNKQFHFESCVAYLYRCGPSCDSLISDAMKGKILAGIDQRLHASAKAPARQPAARH